MNKYAITLGAAILSLAAGGAYADPASNGGVLTINGELVATTCTVSGEGQGNNFAVTLPKVSVNALSAAGSTAGTTGFTIALSACDPKSGKVRTYWERGANTLANGNLKNTGAASNVEVSLINNNVTWGKMDVSKLDDAQNSQAVSIGTDGTAQLKYAAQYVSPDGGATAGTVTTSVTYSMIYH